MKDTVTVANGLIWLMCREPLLLTALYPFIIQLQGAISSNCEAMIVLEQHRRYTAPASSCYDSLSLSLSVSVSVSLSLSLTNSLTTYRVVDRWLHKNGSHFPYYDMHTHIMSFIYIRTYIHVHSALHSKL